MSDPIVSPPSLTGFQSWAAAVMGLTTIVIPANDPGYNYAFQVATNIAPQAPWFSADIQTLVTYKIAASQLLQYQQDQPGQTFFATARKNFGMNSFVAGVITSTSDETTSASMTIGKGLSNLDLMSLQLATNPYGRQALAFMQALGTNWGLS